MSETSTQLDRLCVNTIRCLAADAVEKAKSGHPGAPMGMAPMAYVLWNQFLKHNPKNPRWDNRDRFVLSAGHASMLIYSMLHLSGYAVSLDDIKNFRQWGAKTAGHPEHGLAPGVETTTGPLGQGFSNAVGMALAEKFLAAHFNRPDAAIVDHYTYVIASDGDMMEGISYEAASLAGHFGLGKLICLYDDNQITIDGGTELAFSENVPKLFEAQGWHVQTVRDGDTDLDGISKAITAAQNEKSKPSLIAVKTTIGYGAPNKGNTAGSHGAPLGAAEVKAVKKTLGWSEDQHFYIPNEVKSEMSRAASKGDSRESEWNAFWSAYRKARPELAEQYKAFVSGEIPRDLEAGLPKFNIGDGAVATRAASGKTLNALAGKLPNLLSGCADLSDSVKTTLKDGGSFSAKNAAGRNIHFGVREHAMGAVLNGMALHGGVIPVGGTFLIFSDYMKPAIRLAALMGLPSIFVFSHDSIALGEDGPTHQPVEQLVGLRSIPGLVVLRPGDANETRAAWVDAVSRRNGPTAIVLTRQDLPVYAPPDFSAEDIAKGAYIVCEGKNNRPDLMLVATGSEVHLALAAQKELAKKGKSVRVVSMPSWELFESQSRAYQDQVLPRGVKRLAIEAASPMGWEKYSDAGIFMTTFGASAPGGVLLEKFGFTVDNVVKKALNIL